MRWNELGQLLGTAALGVALAACGGHDHNDASANSDTTSTTTTATATVGPIAQLEKSGALPKLDRSASLAGPDADGNGVRDDIDAYINGKFSDLKQRKAVLQDARAMQKAVLVDATNKEATKAVSLEIFASVNCMFSAFPDGEGQVSPIAIGGKIEAITANTKTRLKAYLAYNKSRDGTASTMPQGDTCE